MYLSQPHFSLLEIGNSKLAFCVRILAIVRISEAFFFFLTESTFTDYTHGICCYKDKVSARRDQISRYNNGCLKITPWFASATKVVYSGTADPEAKAQRQDGGSSARPSKCPQGLPLGHHSQISGCKVQPRECSQQYLINFVRRQVDTGLLAVIIL